MPGKAYFVYFFFFTLQKHLRNKANSQYLFCYSSILLINQTAESHKDILYQANPFHIVYLIIYIMEAAVHFSNRITLFVRILASITIVLAILGLIGWLFNYLPLRTFLISNAVMKVNTAILLILAAGNLIQMASKKPYFWLVLLLSGIIVLISLAIMLEHWHILSLNLDELLGTDSKIGSSSPGRISIAGAICFFCIGIAFPCFIYKRYSAGHILAIIVFLTGYLIFLGHLFQINDYYDFKSYSAMSVHSSFAFLCIAQGLLLLYPQHGIVSIVTGPYLGNLMARYVFGIAMLGVPPIIVLYLYGLNQNLYTPAMGALLILIFFFTTIFLIYHFIFSKVNRLDQELHKRYEQLLLGEELSQVGSYETEYENFTFRGTPQLYRIFGWPIELAYTDSSLDLLYNIIHPDDVERVRVIVDKALKDIAPYSINYRVILPDGQLKYIYIKARVYKNQDGILCAKGTAMDVTVTKQQEAQLQELNRELTLRNKAIQSTNEELQVMSEELSLSNGALRVSNEELTALKADLEFKVSERTAHLERTLSELKQRNEELDQYVYKVSHDIRSPVASIAGLLSLIDVESDLEKKHQYIKLIGNRVDRLEEFINSILNHSRSLFNALEYKPVSLNKIIQQCLHELEYYPGFDQVQVVIDMPASDSIQSDELQLLIIFKNLLSNAIKYHNPRTESKVWVCVSYTDNYTNIRIQDNGIGIAPEYLGKIFQMFFRATQRADGSGLGLYIVRQAVDRLHGKITVQSEEGKGTKFTIVLPVAHVNS
ncbi:sensor histidine kinase [Xanthocytophaga flava]|uniref:sensor histidine kinase n=1 Tax=Xanthocytophaga flava TaxID=3048013 RepID=UPI0028D3A21A|nr:ATP-binding protein [Xanthocytophaga flavus]